MFSFTILDKAYSALDVELIAVVTCDLINSVSYKAQFGVRDSTASLVYARSVVLWERAPLRVCDLYVTGAGMPSSQHRAELCDLSGIVVGVMVLHLKDRDDKVQ